MKKQSPDIRYLSNSDFYVLKLAVKEKWSPRTQAFAFSVITVNDEYTKPRFKRKRSSWIQFYWQYWNTNSCEFFSCGNLILHQKQGIKMIKTQLLWWETTEKCQKSRWKHKVVFLFWTHSTHPWCNMFQISERQRNMTWSDEVVSDKLSKGSISTELYLKVRFECDWYFCNITKSGWLWKQMFWDKILNNHFLKPAQK